MKHFRRWVNCNGFFRSKPKLLELIPVSRFVVANNLTIFTLFWIAVINGIRNEIDLVVKKPSII